MKVIKGNQPLQVLSPAAALVKFAVQFFGDSVVMVILFGVLFGNYALSGQFSLLFIVPGILINIAFQALLVREACVSHTSELFRLAWLAC